jgi:hypothetical protein
LELFPEWEGTRSPQRTQRARRIRQHLAWLLLSAALTPDGVLMVFSISFRKYT